MDDDFELEDNSIEEVKEVVKDILSTLPKSSEYSLVPMYYKFNEDLEIKLEPLLDEDSTLHNICLKTGNLAWVKGFQTAMKYYTDTFGLRMKEAPPIRISRVINNPTVANIDMFMKEFNKPKPLALPYIIMDWQAFIWGIFFASCVWFLLALFGLLG